MARPGARIADRGGESDAAAQMNLRPRSPRPLRHVPFRPAHPRVLGICAWRRFPVMERVIVTAAGWVIRTRIEWMGIN
jgi:hypothetical protein